MNGLSFPLLYACELQEEETISSLFDRAGALYGIDGRVYADLFLHRASSVWGIAVPKVTDWDNPPPVVKKMISVSTGISAEALERHIIRDSPRWTAPGARSGWCPRCFAKDIFFAGGIAYFRRDWSLAARTFCYRHDTPQPLYCWPDSRPDKHRFTGGRLLPIELVTDSDVTLTSKRFKEFKSRQLEAFCSLIYSYPKGEHSDPWELYELRDWEHELDVSLSLIDESLDIRQEVRNEQYSDDAYADLRRINTSRGCCSEIQSLTRLLNSRFFQSGRFQPGVGGWAWHTLTERQSALNLRGRGGKTEINPVEAWRRIRRAKDPAERRAMYWLVACGQSDMFKTLDRATSVFVSVIQLELHRADKK